MMHQLIQECAWQEKYTYAVCGAVLLKAFERTTLCLMLSRILCFSEAYTNFAECKYKTTQNRPYCVFLQER